MEARNSSFSTLGHSRLCDDNYKQKCIQANILKKEKKSIQDKTQIYKW